MDNKDKAIKSAMKNETKAAPGELDNNDDEKVKLSHGSQYDAVKETKAAPGELDNTEDEKDVVLKTINKFEGIIVRNRLKIDADFLLQAKQEKL